MGPRQSWIRPPKFQQSNAPCELVSALEICGDPKLTLMTRLEVSSRKPCGTVKWDRMIFPKVMAKHRAWKFFDPKRSGNLLSWILALCWNPAPGVTTHPTWESWIIPKQLGDGTMARWGPTFCFWFGRWARRRRISRCGCPSGKCVGAVPYQLMQFESLPVGGSAQGKNTGMIMLCPEDLWTSGYSGSLPLTLVWLWQENSSKLTVPDWKMNFACPIYLCSKLMKKCFNKWLMPGRCSQRSEIRVV